MLREHSQKIDWETFFTGITPGKTVLEFGADAAVFRQGDPADSVFYLRHGQVELMVTSGQGKEAVVATLGAGEFFGEGCLAGQPLRIATATTRAVSTLVRIDKPLMLRLLHEQHAFAELFTARLLSRNLRYEEDLVGQLFNSSEKRLARILLLLAHFGKESRSETVAPRVSQKALAQLLGISRWKVNQFLGKFRTRGLISYGSNRALTVHGGLLGVVLQDQVHEE